MTDMRISPVHIIPLSFLLVITVGTLLLLLPQSAACGESADIVTALFTATTSVCVTGLVVVDTYAHWSILGQAIILVLVQIGGLGVVAVASMIMLMGRRKLHLRDIKLLGDSLNYEKNRELVSFLKNIFKAVFCVEGIGALLYAFEFVPVFGIGRGLWISVFQSVSAFCNAGMDVAGPYSMISFRDSTYLMTVTMVLIVLGGLGFVVWFDLIDRVRAGVRGHISEHSRLVLLMTAVLLLTGGVLIFILEYNNPATIGDMGLFDKVLNSLFQSVTFRTAGFASIPQEHLTEASCLVGYILMFIGGSPVGTAGGVKTVTVFLVLMNAFSYIKGKREVVVFHRRVSTENMRKAAAIVFSSFCAVFIMTLLLMSVGRVNLTDALYEVVSALATVGLSRGLTATLNTGGRIIIIVSMFLGRIGPISMALFFSKSNVSGNKIKHAEGTFYVG